jgi:hypothetical protein
MNKQGMPMKDSLLAQHGIYDICLFTQVDIYSLKVQYFVYNGISR